VSTTSPATTSPASTGITPARGSHRDPWSVEANDPTRSPWDVPSIEEYERQLAQRGVVDQVLDDAATDPASGSATGGQDLAERLIWIGAHGGAGARAIAAAAGVGRTGTEARRAALDDTLLPQPAAVVVARSDTRGLEAAAAAIRTVPAGVQLVGLLVSADAPGRVPKDLRTRMHELSGTVPVLVNVPWINQWRVTPGSPHTSIDRALAQLGITSTARSTN